MASTAIAMIVATAKIACSLWTASLTDRRLTAATRMPTSVVMARSRNDPVPPMPGTVRVSLERARSARSVGMVGDMSGVAPSGTTPWSVTSTM